MKKLLTILFSLLIGVAIGYYVHHPQIDESPPPEVVVLHDTVPSLAPEIKEEMSLKPVTALLPINSYKKNKKSQRSDTTSLMAALVTDSGELGSHPPDSVEVVIPMSQRVYEDSTYRAYVSGYNAVLDSIFVFRRSEYITKTRIHESRPKRFSVGLQAGYGYTPKGCQPYVGLGVSVNLLSF